MSETNIKKVSLYLVGFIWLIVGIVLSYVGIMWLLKLSIGPKLVIFLVASVVIGILKGRFVLGKAAVKYYKRSETLKLNSGIDILIGWVKILGIKGFMLIGIMAALGSYLRHSSIDRPILGIIYLAVGIALVYASKIFFSSKA